MLPVTLQAPVGSSANLTARAQRELAGSTGGTRWTDSPSEGVTFFIKLKWIIRV